MSQQPNTPHPTPAWGTPTGPVTAGTSPLAETQVVTSVPAPNPRFANVTKAEVELRVTALHYARLVLGDTTTDNPDNALATTIRIAKGVEHYLLTGQTV